MATIARAWLPAAIVACVGVASLGVVTATGYCAEREPIKWPEAQYQPVDWGNIDGWTTDDHATAFAAFLESCRALNGAHQQTAQPSTITDALRAVCLRAVAAGPLGVKGGRPVGRRQVEPSVDRGQIEDGALDGWHLEICWVRNQVDVMFAQIQG